MIHWLKLGGSLITEKSKAHTIRAEIIQRIGEEIAAARQQLPGLQLVLGHGSGSFGHIPAKKYGTIHGVQTIQDWQGFAEVHHEAAALNRMTLDILRSCGLPCICFDPLSAVRTRNRAVVRWETSPIWQALSNGLIPIVYGDTVFDDALGGTILSTEALFAHLIRTSPQPSRLLLAGKEAGIWEDFPIRNKLIRQFDCSLFDKSQVEFIQTSINPDVTGGMRSKAAFVSDLIKSGKVKEALIFSGEEKGNVFSALQGDRPGTSFMTENNA